MAKKKKQDTKIYMHGYAHLSVIPIRIRPVDNELMVTQLLFGESFHIIEKKNKHWIKILPSSYQPAGWVKSNQVTLCDEQTFQNTFIDTALTLEVSYPILHDDSQKPLLIGSTLPDFDGIQCKLGDNSLIYIYNGQVSSTNGLEFSPELFLKICKRFILSPELLGGRTPFGIDATSLVQHIFKFFSINLPRNANEQFLHGEIIDFVELAQIGDLLFCIDKFGEINHVGINIGEKQVIHVYGHVRIDKFDHFGIYNDDVQKYTHKLRLIKRLF